MTMVAPNPALTPVIDEVEGPRRSLLGIVVGFVRHQPFGTVGVLIVVIVAFAGIFANWIAPYDPTANDFASMTQPPSWAHLLGTDQFGRDVFSRVLYGARIALWVSMVSVGTALALGSFLGMIAG